jgi:hypothetical protein
MARCNSCNGIITKTHVECYACEDPVPRAARRARRSKPESEPKKSNKSHGWFFFAVLGLSLLAIPSRAFGYADPRTGAFVYQVAYAAFLGGDLLPWEVAKSPLAQAGPDERAYSSLAYNRSAASAGTLRVQTRLN